MTKPNKVNRIDRNRRMIAGLQKHYEPTDTVLVDGVAVQQQAIVSTLQASSDATDATDTAEAAYHKAVAGETAANEKADATFASVKDYFLLVNKSTPEVLTDYGLEAVVKKSPTVATKAAAVAKSKATKAAGGKKAVASQATVPASAPLAPAAATPSTTPKS
ncbi:MAG TPA: hypothetical protein VGG39_21415 [Polyangiaceae bacterium]|jgi:hypothetical protein